MGGLFGSAPSGPSPEEIAAEDAAAAQQAQSESNLMLQQQTLEKQRANQTATQAAATQANADSLLAKEQQLRIAGVAADDTNNKPSAVVSTNPAVVGNVLTAGKTATAPAVAAVGQVGS